MDNILLYLFCKEKVYLFGRLNVMRELVQGYFILLDRIQPEIALID
jgi:hypothetical protein